MTNSRRKTIATKSEMTLKSTFYWRGPFLDSFHYNDISFPEKRSHKGRKAQLTTWHERVNQGWKISRDNLCQIGSSLLILWNVFASCSIVFVELRGKWEKNIITTVIFRFQEVFVFECIVSWKYHKLALMKRKLQIIFVGFSFT